MAEYCNDNFQMYEDNQDSFQFFQALVGPYFTPSISEDGIITWTNNGNLPNPDPVNVRGPVGVGIDEIRQNPDYTMTIIYTDGTSWTTPVPVRGQIGPTPDFSIGTVTTGAPGTDAAATITGTDEAPVLNLTIPQGVPGEVTAASMAPVYSTSATYAVGDYVTYNGQLYRCTTEIPTAEAWTAAHWTAAAIAPEVDDLKAAFHNEIGNIADLGIESFANTFSSGTIASNGAVNSTELTRIRTIGLTSEQNPGDAYVVILPPYEGRVALYNEKPISAATFYSFVNNFEQGAIAIPNDCIGKYVNVLIRKKGYESADISADVPNIGNYVRFFYGQNLRATKKTARLFSLQDYVVAAISARGTSTASATRIRTDRCVQIPKYSKLVFDPLVEYRLAEYSSNNGYGGTFIAWLNDWSNTEINVGQYAGKYVRILARYKASPSSPISDPKPFYDYINIEYTEPVLGRKPFENKFLSVMGDSISAMQGYVPEGNDIYYNGSNHGVTSVNQMWWKIVADKLGMIPCVINALSGSGVTQLEDSAHINKTPMSASSRCTNLSLNWMYPDVIIIAGGLNDYTYAESAQSEPLTWDGLQAPTDLTSFTEQYAIMINRIRTAYPKAIIVALSTFFSCRGTSNGYTRTHTVGNNTYTQTDYNEAIKRVCDLMDVPYLDVSDIGFNANNYYPTYAEDSSTIPTHPNALGHSVIGNFVADNLVNIVSGYLST